MTFSADKMAFWPIATVWDILDQLLAEPLFHPMHIPNVLQILLRMSSCFTSGEKVPLKNMVEWWLFRKITFRSSFQSFHPFNVQGYLFGTKQNKPSHSKVATSH
jgi:hypothetical protein